MQLQQLWLVHRLKKEQHTPPLLDSPSLARGIFHLETCQREIWLSPSLDTLPKKLGRPTALHEFEYYEGADAYHFLLSVACGLQSELQGENEVFGQLRFAYHAYKKSDYPKLSAETAKAFETIFRYLFEDAKDVRARYLQTIGNQSYGGILRACLDRNGKDNGSSKALVLGAGHLAEELMPWLAKMEVSLYNRTFEKALNLAQKLDDQKKMKVEVLASPSAMRQAFLSADFVIICAPLAHTEFEVPAGFGGKIFHLGARGQEATLWKALHSATTLDDLFEIQKTKSESRSLWIKAAERACFEKTKLRELGGVFAHGWEDLAAFL